MEDLFLQKLFDLFIVIEPCTTISRLPFSFLTQSKQTITNFNFQNFSAFLQKNFRLLGGGLSPVPLPLATPLTVVINNIFL